MYYDLHFETTEYIDFKYFYHINHGIIHLFAGLYEEIFLEGLFSYGLALLKTIQLFGKLCILRHTFANYFLT